ncbi:hypothetical protein [Microlunatus sagamiharensis]|uniref:hypothetical protein n=1 Tax=Microlunatus sagamiharensis TaxID=546874 RepID=UPI0012FE4AD3|nr:hypothetical protein [Microlunatus sagamiharensis]
MSLDVSVPLVAVGHFWVLRQLLAKVPRELTVVVTLDDRHEWAFVEPGWRPLSIAVTETAMLLWSARNVHEFGPTGLSASIGLDEDVEWALPLASSELLVICETSVRKLREGRVVERIDLQDTFESVRHVEDAIVITDAAGIEYTVDLAADTRANNYPSA